MVIIMCKTSEARQAAVISLPLSLFLFPFLLPSPDLVVHLCLPIYLLGGFPVGKKCERITKQCDAKMTSASTLWRKSPHGWRIRRGFPEGISIARI